MSSRKWAFLSIGMTFIVLLCMAITAYAVDPFLQYRITDRNYLLKSRFVNAGVIKNHNYDTAVIGSSMIQNFNMQSFRDKLNVEPIKATISGISLPEIEELTVLLNNVGKCKNMFVCIDLHAMDSTADPESSRLPYYLYDNKKWNDYRYLLGYEAWMRFIPADIAVSLIYPPGSDMPLSISKNTDLDMLENWANDHEFGEHIVKDIYLNDKITYSKPNLDNLYERMEERVIEFLDTFEYDKEITFLSTLFCSILA